MYPFLHKLFVVVIFSSVSLAALPVEITSNDGINESKRVHTTYNSCGGYIETKLDEIIVLEYKVGEEYDNDELCVWVVRNGVCDGALFTKTESGFEPGYDYIQVSGFNRAETPPTYNGQMGNVTGMEQVGGQAHINFVIFSTDYSNTGTGFRLEILGYKATSSPRWYDDFISLSPVGNVELRPYHYNMVQSFVILPKHKTVPSLILDVEYVTEQRYDHISVYTMERNGRSINFKQHYGGLSGEGNVRCEATYYANFIVIFYANHATIPEKGGISLNWYEPDNSTNAN